MAYLRLCGLIINECLPNFNADANCLTTAIGCLRQNSCNWGLKACFLFSRNTDGVGGCNCSRVSRCVGISGGAGGGESVDSIEHVAGVSLTSIVLF